MFGCSTCAKYDPMSHVAKDRALMQRVLDDHHAKHKADLDTIRRLSLEVEGLRSQVQRIGTERDAAYVGYQQLKNSLDRIVREHRRPA